MPTSWYKKNGTDVQKRKWFYLDVCAPVVLSLLGYEMHFTDSAVS